MRIFISYARVDKGICTKITQTIDIYDIWFDQRLYVGEDWWEEILRRLEWCDSFIYLLSPDSVSSEYCRREYNLARKLGKHILPILIDGNTVIPKDLGRFQYLDLSKGMGIDAVKMLFNALYMVDQKIQKNKPQAPISEITQSDIAPPALNATTIIGKAADAMESGKFDEAVFLLKQAKEKGYNSKFVNIDALLGEAEVLLERQAMLKVVEQEYQTISELVKRPATRKLGCQAFRAFRKDFPDYDPDNLLQYCSNTNTANTNNGHQVLQAGANAVVPRIGIVSNPAPASASATQSQESQLDTISLSPDEPLPLLEWCTIPAGRLTLMETTNPDTGATAQTIKVGQFVMAKYPVTNAQFDVFVKDPQGYANDKWWQFSSYAIDWHRKNPKPLEPRFGGADRPRENVCWYEAMAFCNWLGDRINKMVTLPTRHQWRRAAQGDTTNLYPWGTDFDKNACNTRESRIRMTTLVMRYMNGASPFGVYDMAGNVWEWCLDIANEYSQADPLKSNAPRTVMGGSYKTSYQRAQSTFHFDLDPDYHYGTIGFRVICLV